MAIKIRYEIMGIYIIIGDVSPEVVKKVCVRIVTHVSSSPPRGEYFQKEKKVKNEILKLKKT